MEIYQPRLPDNWEKGQGKVKDYKRFEIITSGFFFDGRHDKCRTKSYGIVDLCESYAYKDSN